MDAHPNFDERILALLAEGIPGKFKKVPLTKQTRLQSDLGLDSLGLAAMVFRLEEEFGIDLTGLDLGNSMGQMRTVGDAIDVSREIVRRAEAAGGE